MKKNNIRSIRFSDELNSEEQELVDKWDNGFDFGLARMCQDLTGRY